MVHTQCDHGTEPDRMDLCGLWRFQPDAFDDGERQGYQDRTLDTHLWREVTVPCAFDDCHPQLTAYEGMGWFRRVFHVPADWIDREQRLFLRFEGVNYNARVWVNGQLAGTHRGGFLRFDLDVSDLLVAGSNVISVRVDSTRRTGEVPGKERGWRPYGGILREVVLLRRPSLRLEQPVLVARADGDFQVRVTVRNDTVQPCEVRVQVRVEDATGMAIATCESPSETVDAKSGRIDEQGTTVTGVTAWTPEQPALYTCILSLEGAGSRDEIRVPFGFRTIERAGTQLLLNDRPIRLRGFNRHEDSPHTGMTPDPTRVESDLRRMKEMGANFVRLCHYPHHPQELDLCDRLGMLVMGEIPLYWWNGDADPEHPAVETLELARQQLSEMIARDINHPSILFWSVSNESQEQRPEVAAGNAALIGHARQLDPTRLAVHVANHTLPMPHFEEDDVICVNAYPSWDGRGWKSNPTYDFADSTRWWDEFLGHLHDRFPERPILVTEFGYPALRGVFANSLGEDTQVAALKAEAQAFDKPYVCGMTVWCFADHPWPEEPFINYLTNSPFGVVTRDRKRKRAYDTVRSLFQAPPLPVQDDPTDNITVRMIRPHLHDIPDVSFPPGYSVRLLRRNEGGLWEDIWRDAEPFSKIENGLFNWEFGDDPAAIERRCYIITAADGVAVGTISAWYTRDAQGLDYGMIHWVATRKAYQGKGIMRAGLSYALKQLAQWHDRAQLGTSTGRIGAIKLYLDFGFVPDLTQPRAREAWEAYRRKLNHPALAILDEPT